MATNSKVSVDTWSGDAALHGMPDAEEQAFVRVGLDSVRLHGTVPEEAADRLIDAILVELRSR